MKIKLTLLIVIALFMSNALKAQTGTLDGAFNVGNGANAAVSTSITQSDGKVIIGGAFTQYNGVPRNRVARLNQDGSLDNSFNIGSGFDNNVKSLAIQSNGQILVGGGFETVAGNTIRRIARLNTDGSLDLTFNNSNPGTITSTFTSGSVNAIAIQNDGKIVVGGVSGNIGSQTYPYIARLDVNGVVETPVFNNTNALLVNDIAIQNDGKIVVAGTRNDNLANSKIARYNPDGSWDNSFNAGSGYTRDQTGISSSSPAVVRSLAIDANGKIIIVGNFTVFNGFNCNRIARLNSDGSFDASFNIGSGAIFSNNIYQGGIYDVDIQSNGKIIIVGYFSSYNSTNSNYIARLNSDGSFDDTYYIITYGTNNVVNTIHIQPNGGIIIGGEFTTYTPNFSIVTPKRVARIIGDCVPPNAPAGLANQSFCYSATTSDLIVNGSNIQWYSDSQGINPIDLTTALVDGNTYYASQTETCESTTTLPVTVTITQPTTPTFNQINPICVGGSLNSLPNLSNNGINGTWNPQINNQTTTTYTFEPNINECAWSIELTIVVNPLPNVTLTAFNSICDTSGIVNLTGGTPVGGTYSGTSVSNNTFNSAVGVGTYPITYSYTNNNGCSKSASKNLSVIDCSGVGLEDLTVNEVSVYPNPTDNIFTIEVSDFIIGQTFAIFDIRGRLLLIGKLNETKTPINVSSFATGTYYVNLPESNKMMKLIKQ